MNSTNGQHETSQLPSQTSSVEFNLTSTSLSSPSSDIVELATNAGALSALPVELLYCLLATSLTSPSDQIALGRSCKWLYQVIKSTDAWQLLSSSSSPLSAFARPLFGHSLSLLEPLADSDAAKYAICLPLSRTSGKWPWAYCQNVGGSMIHARPLVTRPLLPTLNTTRQLGDDFDEQDGPVLPLFLTQSHFDSALPLLQAQALPILITDLMSGKGPGERIPSIPRAIITCFFPRIVHNMTTKLALAESKPTAHDLEALVQVHLVWRAMIQRYAQDAHRWIATETQRRVHVLQGGGIAAREEPLMELVALLHVCGQQESKAWTWPKVAHRVVEENAIRLFEYARCCDDCESRFEKEMPIDQFATQVGNKLTSHRLDGYGFVHWPVVLFHLQFMRTLRSIPNLNNTATYAGQFVDNQRLEPGRLARVLQAKLERIRHQLSADSWSHLMQRLGSLPMEPDARDKWLAWCDKQAQARGKPREYRTGLSCYGTDCPICALHNASSDDNDESSAMAKECGISSVTLSRYLLFPASRFIQKSTDPIPAPSFSFIALNRRGALLGVYAQDPCSNMTKFKSSPPSVFPTASILQSMPSPSGGTAQTLLQLDRLPSQITFVAVIVVDPVSKSLLYATTTPPARSVFQYLDAHDSTKAKETKTPARSRLAYICCRSMQDGSGTWRLARANSLCRKEKKTTGGEHAWVILSPAGEVATVTQSVEIAQEWVEEYVFTCQERGLDHLGMDLQTGGWWDEHWEDGISRFFGNGLG